MSEWVTLAEANLYFTTRLGATVKWNNQTDADKQAALTTSYNRITNDTNYSIPVSPSAAALAKLQFCQEELAYYMVIHLKDEDKRVGLQAQGIIEAGIVKEKYLQDRPIDIPYPPAVKDILDDEFFNSSKSGFYVKEIGRDESQDINADVVGNNWHSCY